MNTIAWIMWAAWWRGALSTPDDRCTRCLRPGHVAASYPDEFWGPR